MDPAKLGSKMPRILVNARTKYQVNKLTDLFNEKREQFKSKFALGGCFALYGVSFLYVAFIDQATKQLVYKDFEELKTRTYDF